jgi:uncharacterized protein
MDKELIIEQAKEFVKNRLQNASSGHDWLHICRVHKNAMDIACGDTDVDAFVIELAVIFHGAADWKFCDGDETLAPQITKEFLEKHAIDRSIIDHVCDIIKNISYKGQGEETVMKTKEGKIVQDADRLDAMGAMGIARTFAYGGARGHVMYSSEVKPVFYENFEQYKKNSGPIVNHFYEKLLLLKDRMNTDKAKEIAEKRQLVMVNFLDEFFAEIGMPKFDTAV